MSSLNYMGLSFLICIRDHKVAAPATTPRLLKGLNLTMYVQVLCKGAIMYCCDAGLCLPACFPLYHVLNQRAKQVLLCICSHVLINIQPEKQIWRVDDKGGKGY